MKILRTKSQQFLTSFNISRKNLTKHFLSKATSSYQYLDLVTTPCACSLKTLPGDRTSCGGSLYQCYCIKTVMLWVVLGAGRRDGFAKMPHSSLHAISDRHLTFGYCDQIGRKDLLRVALATGFHNPTQRLDEPFIKTFIITPHLWCPLRPHQITLYSLRWDTQYLL